MNKSRIHPLNHPIDEYIPIESMNRTMSPIESNTGQQNLSNNRHTNLSNRNTFHNGTVDLQPVSAASRNSRSCVVFTAIGLAILLVIVTTIVVPTIFLTRKANNSNALSASTMSAILNSQSDGASLPIGATTDSVGIASASSAIVGTFSTPSTTAEMHACVNSNPCKNGGTCHSLGKDKFSCDCTKYYQGLKCESTNMITCDATFNEVFNRNNWIDVLVVIDVTGSMRSCARAIVHWMTHTYASTSIKTYVFFNDGDDKANIEKKINATGGIYSTNSTNFSEVHHVMENAIENGSGGDGPENDVEALLYGVNICPMCRNIVHIADNRAAPRDLELLRYLTNRHIKVVPCELSGGIHPALFEIAVQTKGSLHTIEHDIINLWDIPVGNTIDIGSYTYRRTVKSYDRV